MQKISVTIDLDLLYDELTKAVTIDKINSIAQTPTQSNLYNMNRKLQVTEKRYGILTLGSNSVIGQVLPKDTDINVVYNGITYQGHSHKSIGGRIDRLSSLIPSCFHVGDILDLEYDITTTTLKIKNFIH